MFKATASIVFKVVAVMFVTELILFALSSARPTKVYAALYKDLLGRPKAGVIDLGRNIIARANGWCVERTADNGKKSLMCLRDHDSAVLMIIKTEGNISAYLIFAERRKQAYQLQGPYVMYTSSETMLLLNTES